MLAENKRPTGRDVVRVKDCNRTVELMWSAHTNHTCKITRLDSERYILNDTGELKEFTHIENRAEDKNGVRASLGRLRDALNTNIVDVKNCRWCTFTYAENMTDTKRLQQNFEDFNRRARKKYGHYEYITSAEPQGRGAWHLHVVMIFDHKAPYIPNEELRELWKQGFVTVKRLDNVDNVGAYLTAYLGDMELNEMLQLGEIPSHFEIKEVETEDETGQKIKKSIVKGARIRLYPPNFNLYRCSRGIKKPVIAYDSAVEAQKKACVGSQTFERTIALSDGMGFENILNYRYYNMEVAKKSIMAELLAVLNSKIG